MTSARLDRRHQHLRADPQLPSWTAGHSSTESNTIDLRSSDAGRRRNLPGHYARGPRRASTSATASAGPTRPSPCRTPSDAPTATASIVRHDYTWIEDGPRFCAIRAGPRDLIDAARRDFFDKLSRSQPVQDTGILGTSLLHRDTRSISHIADHRRGAPMPPSSKQPTRRHGRRRSPTSLVAGRRHRRTEQTARPGYTIALRHRPRPRVATLRAITAAEEVRRQARHDKDNHLSTGFLGTPGSARPRRTPTATDLAFRCSSGSAPSPAGATRSTRAPPRCGNAGTPSSPTATSPDPDMNSFNHYAYGSVGEWMYTNIAGITALEAGYKKSPHRPRRPAAG